MPLAHPGDDWPLSDEPKPAHERPTQPQRTVKACPICGRIVVHSCYHDDRSHSSVHMPLQKARDLIELWIAQEERQLKELKDHRDKYHYGK